MPRFDGALLRARRKHLNLTIESLSELSKVAYGSISRFEIGTQRPSVVALERLCRALSCDPNSLFTADEDDDADLRPTDLGTTADAWIAQTLASAPPLTERQAARLSAILFGKAS
jgi:transcriptional regulator with XRE-family HTH domain